jgi:uncharacterized protein (DUF1499 family)
MTMTTTEKRPWTRNVARATIAAAVLVLLAGPLIKFSILPWAAGLGMFAIGAILAGIGGIFCLVALLRKKGGLTAIIAAAFGLSAIIIPVGIVVAARGAPPIHDITTDTQNPPAFVAITAEVRGPDTNPTSYDPAIAPVQQAAYPMLKPLILTDDPDTAFRKALDTAKKQGWVIVDSSEVDGRIEGTATVDWWGFKDDVVIRIKPDGTGSRVDVRSKSRVGKGDLGFNADRIADYLKALAAA